MVLDRMDRFDGVLPPPERDPPVMFAESPVQVFDIQVIDRPCRETAEVCLPFPAGISSTALSLPSSGSLADSSIGSSGSFSRLDPMIPEDCSLLRPKRSLFRIWSWSVRSLFWRRSSLFSFLRAAFSFLICWNCMDISVAAAPAISSSASFSEHSSMRRRIERIRSSLLMASSPLFSSRSSALKDHLRTGGPGQRRDPCTGTGACRSGGACPSGDGSLSGVRRSPDPSGRSQGPAP